MPDEYPLNRTYRSAARLNLQHYVWQQIQGFLLHPNINLASTGDEAADIKIADVGTGTGVWLLELASTLPKSIQFHGFDISLAQSPASQWLPPNVSMSKLDVYDEIPEDLVGKYDVIHIRAFIIVIKDANPESVIRSLMKMLKPGGWIQWTEQDPYTLKIETATMTAQSHLQHSTSLLNHIKSFAFKTAGESPGWISNLSKMFEQLGLQDVVEERLKNPSWNKPNLHDNFLLAFEEVSLNAPNGEAIREAVRGAAMELEESGRGIAVTFESITVVGRKSFD